MRITNSAESAGGGSTVSTTNSGVSSAAFDAVNVGSGATVMFDATHSAHGSQAFAIATGGSAAAADMQWTTKAGSLNTVYGRLYFYATAAPAASHRLLTVATSGGSALNSAIYWSTGQQLLMTDSSANTVITSSSLALNTWHRIEFKIVRSSSAGQLELYVYSGSNMDGTTADYSSVSTANKNTGSAAMAVYSFGSGFDTKANISTFWIDDLGLSDSSYVGPVRPKMATFTDAFTSNTINSSIWTATADTGTAVGQNAGQLYISPASNSAGYAGIHTPAYFDLTGSSVTVEYIQGISTTSGGEQGLEIKLDDSNKFGLVLNGTTLVIRFSENNTGNDTYGGRDDVAMHWWRLRETGGTLYWEISPDRLVWNVLRSKAVTFDITAMLINIYAGTYTSIAAPGTAKFDNLNLASAATASLADNFNDDSTDTTKWNTFGGATTVAETGNRLVITPASNNSSYAGYYSRQSYSLLRSHAIVECVQGITAGPVGGEQILGMYLDNDNYTGFVLNGTGLTFRLRTGGTDNDTSISRDDTAMRWWRIREWGGTIFWDTSPDGFTWTNRRSSASTFSLANVGVYLQAGTYTNVASPGVAIFDNLNYYPASPSASLAWIGT